MVHPDLVNFLLISLLFTECLHDNMRTIPMSQGSIYFKTVLYMALEIIHVIVVKFAFLYCSGLPHLLIIVKFAFLQCSCMGVDISLLFL